MPPAGRLERARWQAVCTIPQMLWVDVRQQGNMSLYPGGDLPAPGGNGSGAFWLWPVDLSGKPPVSTLPATLQLLCTVTTGAFPPNAAVVHAGDPSPHPDWLPVQVWSKHSVVLSLTNPQAIAP